MDFVKKCVQSHVDKLLEFRGRYDKQDYPLKVIKNLFYDLYTDKKTWTMFMNIVGTQQFTDHDKAWDYLMTVRRKIQLEEVHPNLENFLKQDDPITQSLNFSSYISKIESAKNGDNKEIENIEYAYIFYELVSDFVFRWESIGLMDKHADEACYIATEMLPGDANFESFENVFKTFSKIAGLYLAGQNATTGKNFGLYTPISPLW